MYHFRQSGVIHPYSIHPYSIHRYSACTHKQKGVALIVVMLIVAIITVMAVEMSARLQLNVARTTNIKANNQAYWYALGAEQFAQNSLASLKALSGDNINLSQPWAQAFEFPVEGGVIKAELIDMQACFNLNSIDSSFSQNQNNSNSNGNSSVAGNASGEENPVEQPTGNNPNANANAQNNGLTQGQQAFHNLLEIYVPDSLVVDTLRDSLIDWIDEDTTPSNYGAEDADYESLAFPYLAANSQLSHPSEIRLINGIEQAMQLGSLDDLRKVLCVLPQSDIRINVNTITEETAVVLSALLDDNAQGSNSVGADIVQARPEEGFPDKEAFFNLPEVKNLNLDAEKQQWFDVTSEYFKLKTTAEYQGSQFRLTTVFRLGEGGVTIVRREFGGAL